MNIKTDYETEILQFLQQNFEPIKNQFQTDEDTLMLSLKQIYKKIISILPEDYIYESDVYQCLEQLGFKNFLISVPEEKIDEDITLPSKEKFCYLLQKKTAAI
jgi:hypothetical protein